MTNNLRIWKEFVENGQQVGKFLRLLGGTSVTWQSVLVKSTLVADADRAMIVRNGMSTLAASRSTVLACAFSVLSLAI